MLLNISEHLFKRRFLILKGGIRPRISNPHLALPESSRTRGCIIVATAAYSRSRLLLYPEASQSAPRGGLVAQENTGRFPLLVPYLYLRRPASHEFTPGRPVVRSSASTPRTLREEHCAKYTGLFSVPIKRLTLRYTPSQRAETEVSP